MAVTRKMCIFLTILIAMTVTVNSVLLPVNMNFQKTDQRWEKLNESHLQPGISQNIPKEGCRNKTKHLCSPIKEGRVRRAALWDLLDFASKATQKEPIYAPSVLLPKKVKPSLGCRIWNKIFPFGK